MLGLSGHASRPSSSSFRAVTGSVFFRCEARKVHSHADGLKTGGPPKLRTVVPGSSAIACRCVEVSGTKT
jgi:ribonuclease PH